MIRSLLKCAALVPLCAVCLPGVAQTRQLNPLRLSAHHVTASVADLNREADWYERVLGFSRSRLLGDPAGFSMYQMRMPGYRIDLVHQAGSTRQHQAKGAYEQGWLHVVFTSPNVSDAYKYLLVHGTDVKADRDPHGVITHLSLHDPEGNEIGIAQGD